MEKTWVIDRIQLNGVNQKLFCLSPILFSTYMFKLIFIVVNFCIVSTSLNMCILFIYKGSDDSESDYKLIMATNRDEIYKRPAQNMGPWNGEPNVIAGKDVTGGGTWLALSPVSKKIGVLLNHPVAQTRNAVKSRGKIAIDYVKSESSISKFIDGMKEYFKECSGFIFVSLDFRDEDLSVHSYTSNTDNLLEHSQKCQGFGNSAPETPFQKVEAGKRKMEDICRRHNKLEMKEGLVSELIRLLKWDEMHLPDKVLEEQHPDQYKVLSSVYVCKPNVYGTRTHTIVLVTKDGEMEVIEDTMQAPIDMQNPKWARTEFQFKL